VAYQILFGRFGLIWNIRGAHKDEKMKNTFWSFIIIDSKRDASYAASLKVVEDHKCAIQQKIEKWGI